jgi:hypothetical protein
VGIIPFPELLNKSSKEKREKRKEKRVKGRE